MHWTRRRTSRDEGQGAVPGTLGDEPAAEHEPSAARQRCRAAATHEHAHSSRTRTSAMRRTYSWRATALVPRPMTRVPLLPASLLSTRPSYKSLDRLNRPLGTRFKNLVTWELRDPRAGQLAGVSATTHGDAKTSNAITDHDREIVITRSRSPHGTEALRDHDRGHVSPSVHICQYLSMCVNICHTDMCVNICHAGRQAATAAADPQARRDPEVEQTLLVFLPREEHHPRMSRPRSLTRSRPAYLARHARRPPRRAEWPCGAGAAQVEFAVPSGT